MSSQKLNEMCFVHIWRPIIATIINIYSATKGGDERADIAAVDKCLLQVYPVGPSPYWKQVLSCQIGVQRI